jgi:hypothetical protein
MYGLVNQVVEDLVCGRYGQATWEDICARAGLDVPSFVSSEPYPDDMTYRLVAAASEVLGLAPATLLEAFGEHWILYTGRKGYGALLDSAGRTVGEFLHNLPALHTRVGLLFPRLRPPQFACEDEGPTTVRVRYESEREGLAPMVIGLLRGVGDLVGQPVRVTHVVRREDAGHDEFLVHLDGA